MSNAIELLNEAASQGIKLAIVGDTIKCKSNSPISPGIVSKLRENKTAIFRLLEGGKAKTTTGGNTTWLTDHEDELREAGFTDRDLYGQGWFKGLADLSLWQTDNLVVELRGDELCFTWHNGHSTIQQTARPEVSILKLNLGI